MGTRGRRIPVAEAPTDLDALVVQARACRVCEAQLPHGPRPVLQAAASARVLIVGQAPGARVHESGVPWDDKSGERLRDWMGIDRAAFYDAAKLAIIPSGLCYPGKAASGDRPPRPECAPRWLHPLRAQLREVRLTLAVGRYAQREILDRRAGADLTATVRDWRRFAPACFPLPHPSPRNVAWFKANPWFETEVLPALRTAVAQALDLKR